MRVHAFVPLAEAPRGKFVILRHGQEMHFVAAPLSLHAYHAQIVFAFIQEQGRGEAVLISSGQCSILTPGWKVLGGGQYEWLPEERILRLKEKSTAYGKYPAQVVARSAAEILPALGCPGFRLDL